MSSFLKCQVLRPDPGLLILLLVFPLFFFGGPGYDSTRLSKELWNLGHIMFFAVFALEADRIWTAGRFATWRKYLLILLLILALATGIEICQSFISGRFASLRDILFGLAGGLAILAWNATAQKSADRKIVLRAVAFAVVAVCLIPVSLVAIDEYRAWRDFPVLSDFESSLEVSRWEAKGRTILVRDPVKNGQYALMVQLNTDRYSGLALRHFPENWSKAQALTFSIYNPGKMITLHYRIHDWKHRGENQAYFDRYNGHTDLVTGWNTITIPMEAIKNGPKYRKMEMDHIRGFGLFVTEQPVAKILFLDDVKLMGQVSR